MYDYKFDVAAGVVAEPGADYQSDSKHERWIEVLVDSPGAQGLFTYRLPLGVEVQPGDILSVPFGSQQLGAIAIQFVDQLPPDLAPERVRDVEDVVSTGFFPATYWQLLSRVADYYYTPLIQVIKAALPPGLLGRSQRRIRLNATALSTGSEVFLNPPARQILQLLQAQKTGDYSWQYLRSSVANANRGLRDLLKRGWVESYLEPPRIARPKQQQAVTLVLNSFPTDLTQRQREVLEVLRRRGGELWLSELLQICNVSSSVVKALQTKGCVVIQERELLRTSAEPAQIADLPKVLTNQQQSALEVIASLSEFSQVLLHGVTGSGKTEVYLQAIAPILQRRQSALVLVPEIGLTPQLTDRFRARFGDRVAVYHSALSDGERYDTWRQMLAGEPQVVIGTRSAIFAPLPQLGLIVLDEEYDDSYKQDQPAPTYHARTVAKWRAELANCPLILGAATPSLETWVEIAGERGEGRREKGEGRREKGEGRREKGEGEQGSKGAREPGSRGENAQSSNPQSPIPNPQSPIPNPQSPIPITHYLSLPDRVHSRPLPPVEIADMRQELRQGNRSIFSRSLQEALNQLRDRGNQGILFIHRRGYSTFVSCRSCGYVMECPNCDVSLSYHYTREGATELLRCHYCNYCQRQPQRCPQCTSPYLKNFGSGTQRVAEELRNQFPQLRSIRFDSDTTRTKGAHRTLLTQFANREADLLVGTQMLAKGLDLPQVTLVGVVAADGLLNMPDYRSSERAFQILTQVAGRAGRGSDPGRVIIQTYEPENPIIAAVQRHEYESFVETQLQQRAALNYSPYGRLILLRLSGMDAAEVETTAQQLAVRLSPRDDTQMPTFDLLGPAPAPIMRLANRYRWHILLKFRLDAPVELPSLMELRALCPQSVSLTIDVDPLNLG